MEYIRLSDSGLNPGPDWNELVAAQRESRHHPDNAPATPTDLARELGSFVGAASASFIHAGMLDFAADRCVRATVPPFSYDEERAFRAGVMSQHSVASSIQRISDQARVQGGTEQ